MRFVFYPNDNELDDINKGQVEKYLQGHEVVFAVPSENEQFVVFVPPNNLLKDPPQVEVLSSIIEYCFDHEIEYVRLKKINIYNDEVLNEDLNLFKDTNNIFFPVPHIIKEKNIHHIIANAHGPSQLLWHSLETQNKVGSYYFSIKEQGKNFRSFQAKPFNSISDVLTPFGNWTENHMVFEDSGLTSLLREYNIDITSRGVGSIGGCCQ